MAAWSHGPFANDDAADWADELTEAGSLGPARQALAATLDTDGLLEVPEGARATAAAAVVAATFDGDTSGFPAEVVIWIVTHPDAASREDARLAVDALERVTSEESELRDVWGDAAGGTDWAREIESLRTRLVGAIGD